MARSRLGGTDAKTGTATAGSAAKAGKAGSAAKAGKAGSAAKVGKAAKAGKVEPEGWRARARRAPARLIGRTRWLRRLYTRFMLRSIDKRRRKGKPLPDELVTIDRELRKLPPGQRAKAVEQALEMGAAPPEKTNRAARRATQRPSRQSGRGQGHRPGMPPGTPRPRPR